MPPPRTATPPHLSDEIRQPQLRHVDTSRGHKSPVPDEDFWAYEEPVHSEEMEWAAMARIEKNLTRHRRADTKDDQSPIRRERVRYPPGSRAPTQVDSEGQKQPPPPSLSAVRTHYDNLQRYRYQTRSRVKATAFQELGEHALTFEPDRQTLLRNNPVPVPSANWGPVRKEHEFVFHEDDCSPLSRKVDQLMEQTKQREYWELSK